MAEDINDFTTTLSTSLLNDTDIRWSRDVLTQLSITIVVMIMTLIGNITLMFTLACNKKTRKRRISVFLINLALGDLTVCVVTMSTEIFFVAFGEWVLGAVACKVMLYGQMITLASSTFLLTAMSIDRYQVIVKPMRTLTNRPKIWKKVAIAWILAFIFASPQLFIFVQVKVTNSDGTEVHKCKSHGYTEPEWQRKVYMTFLATYVLFIPTIIMTYCYTKIMQTLWNRGKSGSHLRTRIEMRMSGRHDTVRSSKRKAVKLSLTVIFGFLLCWTPYFLISLIRIYSNYSIKVKTFLDFSEKMALVHSALNPIIYGLFNVKFGRLYPCFQAIKSRFARCCFGVEHSKVETRCVTIENHDVKSSLAGSHHRNNTDILAVTDSDTNSVSKLTSNKRETIPLLNTK